MDKGGATKLWHSPQLESAGEQQQVAASAAG